MKAPLRFNYPPEVVLNPRIDAAELGEGVAIHERQRLGLGDQPVIDLRSTLEWDVGLRIFYWDLPSPSRGCTRIRQTWAAAFSSTAGIRRNVGVSRCCTSTAISSWTATGLASTTSP